VGLFALDGFHGELAFDAQPLFVFNHLRPDANGLVRVVLPEHGGHGSGCLVVFQGLNERALGDHVVIVVPHAKDRAVTFDGAVSVDRFNFKANVEVFCFHFFNLSGREFHRACFGGAV